MALDFLQRRLASQLGNPRGLLGSLVARKLNQRNHTAISAAVAALDPTHGQKVADIGYGGGVGLGLLLAAVGRDGLVHGVEPSPSMVARARSEYAPQVRSGHLELHEGTADLLPFAEAELDGWISLNTIYFIADLERSLSEMARVLKPSGSGVLGVADPEWLARQTFAAHGFIVRPLEEVIATATRAGLHATVERLTDPESQLSYNLVVCRRST